MKRPVPERRMSTPVPQVPDPLLLQMLAGRNADDERHVAQTARRRVLGRLHCTKERKQQKRHTVAIATMLALGVLVLLSPAIWAGVENVIADGHFGDMGSQVTLLFLIFFPALLAALIAGWRNGLEVHLGKRDR
jgi:hypothetical protein